jgi:MoCo/4Fe-4S cofactor protein with predicted Tat translocation signal
MSDLAIIRARLAGTRGRTFWRSLDEVLESPAFLELLQREFPRQAAGFVAALDRRHFLKLMGASFALAGLGACTKQPEERIVPYVRQPEGLVLGEPRYYATAMPLHGFGTALLAESHEGRPTKVEGNPDHPSSLGATDATTQGSVLGLYDPDRSQTVLAAGEIRTWDAFLAAVRPALAAQEKTGGAGLRILTETVTSPTLARQIRALLAKFPQARWVQYEVDGRDAVRAGTRRAFGEVVEPHYRLHGAEVVVTLDADLFGRGPARLFHTRQWSRARRPDRTGAAPLRLYAIEGTPTTAGAVADHRVPLRAGDVEAFAARLAAAVGARPASTPPPFADARVERVLAAAAADLASHKGRALVVPGEDQPPRVHALAHAMNVALGAVGKTVVYSEPIEAEPQEQLAALGALVDDMAASRVELLLALGGNPAVTAPADLHFAERLEQVALRVHLSPYDDETSLLCHWHVPEAHYLESWGDVRAHDGSALLIQPLIAPLYGGKTASEVLAALLESPERSAYDVLRATWRTAAAARGAGADFERFWASALHDGVVPGTAPATRTPTLRPDWDAAPVPAPEAGLEVVFRPDPYVDDGRFANNGWLQELPRPITKLTWDNAALVAPATAERFRLANGDVVELRRGERAVRVPVWIVPGHAADAFTLTYGWGRTRAGHVAEGAGVDVFPLRTARAPVILRGVEVLKTDGHVALATTQEHHSMEGRALVRSATLEHWRAHPDFAQHEEEAPSRDTTLYPNRDYTGGHAWGMAIDLDACIGCNACVAACVAENNIAVVGKDQVLRGREMHWIRVDRYWTGDLDDPETAHQPVPCMQCENAPCEVVCPVAATNHSSEGLNDMVYNRCVGTRYCSNNCPYKVRRFNYYLYSDWATETLKMVRNPDVTVRSRGVMEKCTYCVQRIEYVRGHAVAEGRTIRDGEIVTACQQVCPAEAIVFGDVNDPDSRVSRAKRDPRNYALLAELNTRPRTTYLAEVRNRNPDLEKSRT